MSRSSGLSGSSAVDRAGLEGHSADGAGARLAPHDLGMHRAHVLGPGRGSDGHVLEGHAALGARPRHGAPHLGMHGAGVAAARSRWGLRLRRRGFRLGRRGPHGAQVGLGVGLELLQATSAAEPVGGPRVLERARGLLGPNGHSAHRVLRNRARLARAVLTMIRGRAAHGHLLSCGRDHHLCLISSLLQPQEAPRAQLRHLRHSRMPRLRLRCGKLRR